MEPDGREVCRRLDLSGGGLLLLAKGYGGLKVDQAPRLKDPGRADVRLKRAVAGLTLDKQI